MTTRTMYDAISANAASLIPKNPQMLAIYLTGSPDIMWTTKHVIAFPGVKTWVRIDQAGNGAPQYAANVMDYEPGCYHSTADITHWTSRCTAPRPTVYCDRADLPTVMGVWKGDIWLAAPGLSESECLAIRANNKQIVAVQNVFGGTYDSSVVMDTSWPEKVVVNPPPPPPVKTFPVAPAPPGVWKEGAVMVGIGTDGHVYETTYSVATGKWSGTQKVV